MPRDSRDSHASNAGEPTRAISVVAKLLVHYRIKHVVVCRLPGETIHAGELNNKHVVTYAGRGVDGSSSC